MVELVVVLLAALLVVVLPLAVLLVPPLVMRSAGRRPRAALALWGTGVALLAGWVLLGWAQAHGDGTAQGWAPMPGALLVLPAAACAAAAVAVVRRRRGPVER